ncbi:hypothetical protein JAAARDRAFT_51472 [Jaapia argillacea MUCL 33604]|uniref:Uncharacterized protein n=1 Tax=Jaapia argillacea MUCL 33604 TaxID=933084 RepID=A0A067PG63_9AGAM|nr:hypothetical protein JAAARDRAFT_51472 [Jaapia argillacea MUCL 33604]
MDLGVALTSLRALWFAARTQFDAECSSQYPIWTNGLILNIRRVWYGKHDIVTRRIKATLFRDVRRQDPIDSKIRHLLHCSGGHVETNGSESTRDVLRGPKCLRGPSDRQLVTVPPSGRGSSLGGTAPISRRIRPMASVMGSLERDLTEHIGTTRAKEFGPKPSTLAFLCTNLQSLCGMRWEQPIFDIGRRAYDA